MLLKVNISCRVRSLTSINNKEKGVSLGSWFLCPVPTPPRPFTNDSQLIHVPLNGCNREN